MKCDRFLDYSVKENCMLNTGMCRGMNIYWYFMNIYCENNNLSARKSTKN